MMKAICRSLAYVQVLFAVVALSSLPAAAGSSMLVAGSTALQPLVRDAAADFEKNNPGLQIAVGGGGSKTGLMHVANKAVDIGDSDLQAQGHPELIDHRVVVVPFAVILNNANGVTALSKAQLVDIYAGKITNWKAVGGSDIPIVLHTYGASSGSLGVFLKTVMEQVPISSAATVMDSSGMCARSVAANAGAIGFVAAAYVKEKEVTTARIDGALPTPADVSIGKYPIWSYEHMYTNGEPPDLVARFIAYVQTRHDLVNKYGYIPIADMRVSMTDR